MVEILKNSNIDERDSIIELIFKHMKEERTFNSNLRFVDNLDESTHEDLSRWLKGIKCLYIKENTKIIGYCCIKRIDTECTVISDLYIDKSYRGKGYGKVFIDYIKTIYKNDKIILSVISDNINGIEFYKRMGFKSTGIVKKTDHNKVTLDEMIYKPIKKGDK